MTSLEDSIPLSSFTYVHPASQQFERLAIQVILMRIIPRDGLGYS